MASVFCLASFYFQGRYGQSYFVLGLGLELESAPESVRYLQLMRIPAHRCLSLTPKF